MGAKTWLAGLTHDKEGETTNENTYRYNQYLHGFS